MDGFEFIAQVRAESRWRRIPIIVVTAKMLTAEDRARLNGQVYSIWCTRANTAARPCWPALDELVPTPARPARESGSAMSIIDTDSARAWRIRLAHLRQELLSPVNAVLGYAEILHEDVSRNGRPDIPPI